MFEGNQTHGHKSAAVWRSAKSRGNHPGSRIEGQAMKNSDQATDPLDEIKLVPALSS